MAASPESSPALETSHLSKSYKVGHIRQRLRPALIDLTIDVARGEVFGYLGPNGSGKTTTLKVLLGLMRPDAGTAHVLGIPLGDPAWKFRAGYLPEQPYFYDYLTASEYLDYVARLFGMPAPARRERARALLEQVGLEGSASIPMRRFSKGMSQRLGLAQALINDPEIVFLDEPMSGLDPLGRRLVRDLILGLKAQGKTIFFSTHILPDAEALCDRVALLRAGRLVRVGRLAEILEANVAHLEVLVSGGRAPEDAVPGVLSWRMLGERWRLDVAEESLVPVLSWVESRGGRILLVQPARQSLEEYFLREMGQAPEQKEWDQQD
jgi:ABC-2 type transport system ATP-binding protein